MFHYGLCPLGLCPQVSNGISPSTGSGNSPAVFYDLYRHTFLKDCGSHDKKTPPPWGWSVSPIQRPGMVEKGSFQGIWCWSETAHFRAFRGLAPEGGLFQLRSMSLSFRRGT